QHNRNRKLDEFCIANPKAEISNWAVQFAISDLGFKMQDLSDFKIASMNRTGFLPRSIPGCREHPEQQSRLRKQSYRWFSTTRRNTKCCSPSPRWRRRVPPPLRPSGRGRPPVEGRQLSLVSKPGRPLSTA